MLSPFKSNGILHPLSYNKVWMAHDMFGGATVYNSLKSAELPILTLLLHRLFLLFLDHDIIFFLYTTLKKFKKNLSNVLNTFENSMENGAFAPKEQMLRFP